MKDLESSRKVLRRPLSSEPTRINNLLEFLSVLEELSNDTFDSVVARTRAGCFSLSSSLASRCTLRGGERPNLSQSNLLR